MKKLIILSLALILILSACSGAILDSAEKELEDTISNVTNTDDKYVLMVKGGHRTNNPDLSYEEAFSSFFGTPRWKYFKGEDGQDVVEFIGDCTYQDVPVKARIQFVVDEEGGTFEATYLAFNEVPQNMLTLTVLISKAFEDSEALESNNDSEQSYSGNFMYKGKSLSSFLGKSSENISVAFGTPIGGTPVTGELLYGGTEYWAYDDIYFEFDNGIVHQINVKSEKVTFDGMTLNMKPSNLFDKFGEALDEYYIEDEAGEGRDCYYMEYIFDGILVGFEMPDILSESDYMRFSIYENNE